MSKPKGKLLEPTALAGYELAQTVGHQADKLALAGDELALAAARVCTEYDGIHRLRAALSKWYDLRAGIHGSSEPPLKQGKKT